MNYTSIEQSKKLLELGLSPESADLKFKYDYNEHRCVEIPMMVIVPNWDDEYNKDIPCWSLSALLELMPKGIFIEDKDYIIDITPVGYVTSKNPFDCTWQVSYFDSENEDDDYLVSKVNKNLIEAAYNMVVWLLENNYIKKE